MNILFIDRKGGELNKLFFKSIQSYMRSIDDTINIERSESIMDLAQSKNYNLTIIDHPYPKDYEAIRIETTSAEKILITRCNIAQKTLEQDPDHQNIYIIDKTYLTKGITELLTIEKISKN